MGTGAKTVGYNELDKDLIKLVPFITQASYTLPTSLDEFYDNSTPC